MTSNNLIKLLITLLIIFIFIKHYCFYGLNKKRNPQPFQNMIEGFTIDTLSLKIDSSYISSPDLTKGDGLHEGKLEMDGSANLKLIQSDYMKKTDMIKYDPILLKLRGGAEIQILPLRRAELGINAQDDYKFTDAEKKKIISAIESFHSDNQRYIDAGSDIQFFIIGCSSDGVNDCPYDIDYRYNHYKKRIYITEDTSDNLIAYKNTLDIDALISTINNQINNIGILKEINTQNPIPLEKLELIQLSQINTILTNNNTSITNETMRDIFTDTALSSYINSSYSLKLEDDIQDNIETLKETRANLITTSTDKSKKKDITIEYLNKLKTDLNTRIGNENNNRNPVQVENDETLETIKSKLRYLANYTSYQSDKERSTKSFNSLKSLQNGSDISIEKNANTDNTYKIKFKPSDNGTVNGNEKCLSIHPDGTYDIDELCNEEANNENQQFELNPILNMKMYKDNLDKSILSNKFIDPTKKVNFPFYMMKSTYNNNCVQNFNNNLTVEPCQTKQSQRWKPSETKNMCSASKE